MLDKEPFVYPSRGSNYPFDPGVSNRQMWAIGMIVVQWSMTETIIEDNARSLITDDQSLLAEYRAIRNFQQRLAFWQTQVELKLQNPIKSQVLNLIPTIQALNSQRDEVVHRLWGGGLESTSWGAGGASPTTDAGMLPTASENIKSAGAPMRWRATFQRLRRMAQEMATLNRDLFQLLLLPPPHGDVNSVSQVSP
jgi:hypothetical protein